jgi:hypothetical protein
VAGDWNRGVAGDWNRGVVGNRHGEHGGGQPVVVGRRDGTQIEQQPPALDPAGHRGRRAAAHGSARPQAGRQVFGQGQRDRKSVV